MTAQIAPGERRRLISLDALRGFTIAAMVVVNDPGSWQHVYPPLRHADWNGITLTDMIFPFFLFMVGISIVFSYTKRLEDGIPMEKIHRKIVIRSLNIYFLGLFLWLWPTFDFTEIRWVGVLHRIAVVFLACALLFLHTNWKQQAWTGGIILVIYWILVAYVPVPGVGQPDLSVPERNWANYLDTLILPGVLWEETWDPEGILSTFPAIVTGITGLLVGKLYLSFKDRYKRLTYMYLAGFAAFLAGGIWNWFFPVNKNLWTSSYVLYTSGLGAMAFATCIYLVDMKGYRKWTFLGRVFGANAITSYVLAGMLTAVFYGIRFGGVSLNEWFMNILGPTRLDPRFVSMAYAMIYMLIIFLPALYLYRNKIYIRI